MKSVINDLFNGKIAPYENLNLNNPQFAELKDNISKTTEGLNRHLSPEALVEHDKLDELIDTLSDMENTESFARGFRLGTLLMIEVLYNKEDWTDIKDLLNAHK